MLIVADDSPLYRDKMEEKLHSKLAIQPSIIMELHLVQLFGKIKQ